MNTMEVLTLLLVIFAALSYIDNHNNYEKHALRVSQVIAAVAKVSCKHGLWLVASRK